MSIWSLLLLLLRVPLGLCLCGYVAYALLSVWAAHVWQRAQRPIDCAWMPPVTILKPVFGADAHAYDNYASFCRLDYPPERMQLIFGALDANDAALAVVRRLQQDFPRHDIVIVTPPAHIPPAGQNLKVSNLYNMLPTAKHELLVMSDSDVRVAPDYLRHVVAPFQPGADGAASRVGLVTCPYRGFLPESLSARLEALGMGAEFIPGALVGRVTEGMTFAFGSSMALPRRVLAEIGGLEAILDHLADDYLLGYYTQQAGYEVVLTTHLVNNVLGAERFKPMWIRRLRWARTVRAYRPRGHAGAFVTHGTALALLFWAAMGANRAGTLTLLGILALRVVTSLWIARAYTRDEAVSSNWFLLPFSDLLSAALYVGSYTGRQIIWRGQRFRLRAGGKIEHLT